MVKVHEFMESAYCQSLIKRVSLFQDEFITDNPGSYLQCLGYPIYLSCMKNEVRDPEKVLRFNQIMETSFKDVLEKIKIFFEEYLKEKVYYDPAVTYPGFHIIKIRGQNRTKINFHQDTEYTFLSHSFPKLGIGTDPEKLSFTVLLSSFPGGESGLYYVKDLKYTHEYLTSVSDKDSLREELLKKAEFLKYETGLINLHTGLAHALYGENHTDQLGVRISLQGHLVRTSKGYLLYW